MRVSDFVVRNTDNAFLQGSAFPKNVYYLQFPSLIVHFEFGYTLYT